MATDVDVQFFSHLNGLTLGNNWGDLIRLLDKALVTGIDFTQITAASIDAQGDVHITLYAAHNAMLFQVVELSGFVPAAFNQKYRIKGVPSTTELILKPHTAITETNIATTGSGKLASLGYDIIFRDANDVKRVYRAKNPTAQHPFIRVDESLTSPDGTTGVYTSTYAKSAMVGLFEHMGHIDDFENPDVLQLPFDPTDPAKNWKITGTGTNVTRGWVKWFWAIASDIANNPLEAITVVAVNKWEICGDSNFFYLSPSLGDSSGSIGFDVKPFYGCGVVEDALVLLGTTRLLTAGNGTIWDSIPASCPLVHSELASRFYTRKAGQDSVTSTAILPDYRSGQSDIYGGTNVAPLEIPFFAISPKTLQGVLPHVAYSGKNHSLANQATPIISDSSMYIHCKAGFPRIDGQNGGFYFYLGEIE
ncbi:hypothetical protein [Acinetobacter lwoffii]|uniref:hypothetical protein n=1 Tax=Acinetobacter lwoffii TaxID=28090 RepID=UPI0035BBBF67|nr:hypothetical protein ABEDC_2175 [Acinetobacter lwoffii]